MHYLCYSPFLRNAVGKRRISCLTFWASLVHKRNSSLDDRMFLERMWEDFGIAWDIVSERRIGPGHHSFRSYQRLRDMLLDIEGICCIINLDAVLKNK